MCLSARVCACREGGGVQEQVDLTGRMTNRAGSLLFEVGSGKILQANTVYAFTVTLRNPGTHGHVLHARRLALPHHSHTPDEPQNLHVVDAPHTAGTAQAASTPRLFSMQWQAQALLGGAVVMDADTLLTPAVVRQQCAEQLLCVLPCTHTSAPRDRTRDSTGDTAQRPPGEEARTRHC